MSTQHDTVLNAEGIAKSYDRGHRAVLEDITLDVHRHEVIAIVGPSGAGKSTLLNVLGLLDTPDAGAYTLMGTDTRAAGTSLDVLRGRHIGFVFQDSHMLPSRTCAENVALALPPTSVPSNDRSSRVDRALSAVGLSHIAGARASTLSGGERQRAALARAVVKEPDLVLADEPTGNLDPENSGVVVDLLRREAARGAGIVIITHDHHLAAECDRTLVLSHGRLEPA